MPGNVLQDEIVVKTKEGVFKLLKNGRLVDLPSEALMAPADDLTTQEMAEEVAKMSEALKEKPAANFYFDVNDEHEARRLTSKNEEDKNRAIKQHIKKIVDEILKQLNLAGGAMLMTQLQNIIISRLKDVRSLAETRETLLRQGLATDEASKLINLIEQKRAQVEELIKTGKIPIVAEASKDESIEPSKQVSLVVDTRAEEVKKDRLKEKKMAVEKKLDMQGVKYDQGHQAVAGEEIVHHITVGPVDEIRQLSLKEFRRLGANPREAAERLLEKIGLLEDESLIKKAAGIKAWHESEVYQAYLSIGAVSMSQKKPVEQVIREFRAADKPYLAPEEFNVVADLNRKLSY